MQEETCSKHWEVGYTSDTHDKDKSKWEITFNENLWRANKLIFMLVHLSLLLCQSFKDSAGERLSEVACNMTDQYESFLSPAYSGRGYSQENDDSLDLFLLPTETLSEEGASEKQPTACPLLVYFPPAEALTRRFIHCTVSVCKLRGAYKKCELILPPSVLQ